MSEITPAFWFVGASYNDDGDQSARFLRDGIWENGYKDRYLDLVRSMRPGERIAIKAAHTRKRDLPFNANGNTASVMTIKAVGTITENMGDGRRIKVEWSRLPEPKPWYFYTLRLTIHKVVPDNWMRQELIAFTFDGATQDLSRFRNDPFWKGRFGDKDNSNEQFQWTRFYSAVARSLLAYKDDRTDLVQKINDLAIRRNLSHLRDEVERGIRTPMEDVCPFTVMGIFNRGNTTENRKQLAKEVADILGVTEPVPANFDGIPLLDNRKSCFYSFARERKPDDIPTLWRVLQAATDLVDSDGAEAHRLGFIEAYNEARSVRGVSWNLTMGLYWAHPWEFLTLDGVSRAYLQTSMGVIQHPALHPGHEGDAYFDLKDRLEEAFLRPDSLAHSFPELSWKAWEKAGEAIDGGTEGFEGREELQDAPFLRQEQESIVERSPAVAPYDISSLVSEGCFLPAPYLDGILATWREKKNLILQGAPGTGKTWLAKRLGYALMGSKDRSRLRSFQFHPNLSYEDFVRGFRPTVGGALVVQDGPFLEMVDLASSRPDEDVVLVVEEINRGNPAQIFGELLTLLEASKRHPDEAVELSYKDRDGKSLPVHLPPNLYLVGTMNIADRSLALVDLALRRRFAFVTLEPLLNGAWAQWLVEKYGIEREFVDTIRTRIEALNKQITTAPGLGKSFQIGHSFVTPSPDANIVDGIAWFRQVVETEIVPLLGEYWFDHPARIESESKALLAP